MIREEIQSILITNVPCDAQTREFFIKGLKQETMTRDTNASKHFCVYFFLT